MNRLTPNFVLEEFRVSSSFPALANLIEFTREDELKCFLLASQFLQPVRDTFGTTKILSGKRSDVLNKAVVGANYSDHLFVPGTSKAAVDFTCHANMGDVFEMLKTTRRTYGQLIWYRKSNFLHVSLPTPTHRSEEIVWEK